MNNMYLGHQFKYIILFNYRILIRAAKYHLGQSRNEHGNWEGFFITVY